MGCNAKVVRKRNEDIDSLIKRFDKAVKKANPKKKEDKR